MRRQLPFYAASAVLVACTLTSSRDIVAHSTITSVWHLAQNEDNSTLFVADELGKLRAMDPVAGTVLFTHGLWSDADWEVVDLAMHLDEPDQVWALHHNGYVVEWDSSLTYHDYYAPPAMSGSSSRTYCDVDERSGGDLYMTTVDATRSGDEGRLWRRQSGAWSSVSLGSESYCRKLAIDETGSRSLYTLLPDGFTVERFDADMLSSGLATIDDAAAELNDIDVQAGVVVGAGTWWVTDPQPRVWLFDGLTGAVDDAQHPDVSHPNAVQLTYDQDSGVFESLIGGWNYQGWTVRGILVED